jgi:hypothetical protein
LYGTVILTILYALILPGCVLVQPTEPFSPVPVTEATRITAPAPSQPSPAKEEVVPEALGTGACWNWPCGSAWP